MVNENNRSLEPLKPIGCFDQYIGKRRRQALANRVDLRHMGAHNTDLLGR
jgi:hypothetical protein